MWLDRRVMATASALILGAWLSGAQAQVTIIDGFDTDQAEVSAVSGGTDQNTINNVPIQGASRTIAVTNNQANPAQNVVRAGVTQGRFEYSQSTGVDGFGLITHDNLGGFDMSQFTSLDIRILDDDLPFDITVTLTDTNGASAAQTKKAPGGISILIPSTSPFDLQYSLSGFGGVNLASIRTMSVRLAGLPNLDLQLDYIGLSGEVAPPPAPAPAIGPLGLTMALATLPLLSAIVVVRRRRRS